jgi:hypothetical protein
MALPATVLHCIAQYWELSRRHKCVIADLCFDRAEVSTFPRHSFFFLFFIISLSLLMANVDPLIRVYCLLTQILTSNAIQYSILLVYTVLIYSLPLVNSFCIMPQ